MCTISTVYYHVIVFLLGNVCERLPFLSVFTSFTLCLCFSLSLSLSLLSLPLSPPCTPFTLIYALDAKQNAFGHLLKKEEKQMYRCRSVQMFVLVQLHEYVMKVPGLAMKKWRKKEKEKKSSESRLYFCSRLGMISPVRMNTQWHVSMARSQ